MNAQDAIDQSISRNETVHVSASDIDETDLLVECDDCADGNDGTVEYWGTEDGAEWRVHVSR